MHSAIKKHASNILSDILSPPCKNYSHNNLAQLAGEFGIVYKGCLAGQYTDEIVAIKTLKGTGICIIITSGVI